MYRHGILEAALAAFVAACLGLSSASAQPGNGVLSLSSLDEAVALALDRSPLLRAGEARRRASQAERRHAGTYPNPEFTVELENFAGTGDVRGLRSAEVTYGLTQRIETGGKWTARVSVAEAGITLSEREYEIVRRDLIRDARKHYAEAVAAARAVTIERERVNIARDVLRVARERVDAGSEPIIQARKAEIALSTAEVARVRAERELDTALRALAVLLNGDGEVRLSPSQGWFDEIGPAPSTGPEGERLAENSPDYRKWDAELSKSRATLNLERSNIAPDVSVTAGVRRFRESSDTAFVVGLSIPLPVFNTNRFAVERAAQELAKTEAEAQQGRRALLGSVSDVRSKLSMAWEEASVLRRSVLPGAEQAYAFAREGYSAGKFAFLELLDAQRTLAESRARLIEVLRELHTQRAELDRLIGLDRDASTEKRGSPP